MNSATQISLTCGCQEVVAAGLASAELAEKSEEAWKPKVSGFRVWGLGFRVWGLGFRV